MRDEYEKQFAQFNEDVALHSVMVLRDDGLYRHLRCSAGSYHMQFDVVTWPGHLAYCGDMGSYVFTRLPDMFEFFRGRLGAVVDRGYIAEKAVAADASDGICSFCSELFRAAVKDDFDQFVEYQSLSKEEADELWEAIEDDVLSSEDVEADAVDAAMSFRWAPEGRSSHKGREVFCDFWEHRLREFTPRFIWCCYAIPWSIAQYDAASELARTSDARLTQSEGSQAIGSATNSSSSSSLSSMGVREDQ